MKCAICGKEIERSQYFVAVLCSDVCFHKNFWNEIVKEKDEKIIVDGKCYVDGGNSPGTASKYLGHSGRVFNIKFNDGRIITTNNLWYNGKIPEDYLSLLPNNAVFLTEKQIRKDVAY